MNIIAERRKDLLVPQTVAKSVLCRQLCQPRTCIPVRTFRCRQGLLVMSNGTGQLDEMVVVWNRKAPQRLFEGIKCRSLIVKASS